MEAARPVHARSCGKWFPGLLYSHTNKSHNRHHPAGETLCSSEGSGRLRRGGCRRDVRGNDSRTRRLPSPSAIRAPDTQNAGAWCCSASRVHIRIVPCGQSGPAPDLVMDWSCSFSTNLECQYEESGICNKRVFARAQISRSRFKYSIERVPPGIGVLLKFRRRCQKPPYRGIRTGRFFTPETG